MRKLNLLYSLLFLTALYVVSCKKSNTINNSQVIATPYSLYFTDTAGTLYKSNDGKTWNVVFSADGMPTRSIFNMDNNLLMVKTAAYVSNNNGVNFNTSYDAIKVASQSVTNVKGRSMDLSQNMAIFVNNGDWASHAYITSKEWAVGNYFGIAWNASGGAYNTWYLEDYYDTDQVSGGVVGSMRTTSFTQLENGSLVAYDGTNRYALYRTSLGVRWKEMFDASLAATLSVPASPSFFSVGHIHNRIVLIDNYGTSGAYYSDNLGSSWASYAGLPANTPLTCISSPFEQTCLIGTDSAGLYKLNINTDAFELVSGGLPANLVVRSIAFKENIYKNDARRQYIYLATNKGIYKSEDMGVNWVLTIPGNYVSIY